jgi:hypothetical protein
VPLEDGSVWLAQHGIRQADEKQRNDAQQGEEDHDRRIMVKNTVAVRGCAG